MLERMNEQAKKYEKKSEKIRRFPNFSGRYLVKAKVYQRWQRQFFAKKVKKIPMRQCMGCNEHKPKMELLRVVRSPEGDVSLDFVGKKSGRGAYLCPDGACLARARKSRALERAFETAIPDAVYDALEKEMEAHHG